MEYEGEENLNIMKAATNYNKWLVDMICALTEYKDNILDFGSGDGFFAKSVSQQLNKEVICIEPADNLHKYYLQKPLTSLEELREASIDLIYSLNVLEHIEDDKDIVDKFYHAIKPSGTVFLYLPAFPCLWSSMDKLVGHYRRYTKKDVRRLFDTERWKIEEIRYADFCGWFITMLFKLIGSKSGKIKGSEIRIYDKYIFPLSLLLDKITKGKLMGKNIIIKATKK